MAEYTQATAPIPPHTVRHVDGVMHLTLETVANAATPAEAMRIHPPTDPSEEA